MGGCCAGSAAATLPDKRLKDLTTPEPAPSTESDPVVPFDAGLAISPSQVSALGELCLEWCLKEGNPTQGDWIGVYEGIGDDDTGCCISSMVMSGAASGRLVLTAPEKPGQYHFRYFFADGVAAAVSQAFRVLTAGNDVNKIHGSPPLGGVCIINEENQPGTDWASSSLPSAQTTAALSTNEAQIHNYHSVDYNRLENRRSMQLGNSTADSFNLQAAPASYAGERRCSEPAKRRNSGIGPRVSSGADNPVFEIDQGPSSIVSIGDTTQPHSVHTLEGWSSLETNEDAAGLTPQLKGHDGANQWDTMGMGDTMTEPEAGSVEAFKSQSPTKSSKMDPLINTMSTNEDSVPTGPRSNDSILSDGVDTMIEQLMASDAPIPQQGQAQAVQAASTESFTHNSTNFTENTSSAKQQASSLKQGIQVSAQRAAHLLNALSAQDTGLSMPSASERSIKVNLEKAKLANQHKYPDTQSIPVPSAGLTLKVANVSITNINPEEPSSKPNQDAFLVDTCLNGDRNTHLFGVFDGHGPAGHHCAQFVRNNLSDALRCSAHFNESIEKAYHATFRQINAEMHREPSVEDLKSGTTAITVCMRGSELYVANIGDSRAILIQSDQQTSAWSAMDLSNDHTPFRPDELQRVQACGAQVMTLDEIEGLCGPRTPEEWTAEDPPRCWVPCCGYPGTAFTRSVGDLLAESIGVNAVPEVLIHPVTKNDEAIVICSDGVTEFLSSQEVVDMVAKHRGNVLEAANTIAKEAQKLWLECDDHTDDITIIVIMLGHDGTAMDQLEVAKTKPPAAVAYTSMTGDWYDQAFMQLARAQAMRPMPSKRLQSQRRRAEGCASLSLLASLSGTAFEQPEESNAPLDSMSLRLKSSNGEKISFKEYPKSPTDHKTIVTAITNTQLCHRMNQDQVNAIITLMDKVHIPKGSIVFEAGERGEWFYVLCSGEFGVYQDFGNGLELIHKYTRHQYGAAPSFGEMSLLHGRSRPATVKALTDNASLWRLHKQAWLQERKAATEIFAMLPERMQTPYQHPTLLPAKTKDEVNQLEAAVKASPIFCRLAASDRARLFDVMVKTKVNTNDVVYSQGEIGRGMYVVESGDLDVTVTTDEGESKQVHRYTTGSCFGESALIASQVKRGSTVTAKSPCVLWVLHYSAFETTIKLLLSFMGC